VPRTRAAQSGRNPLIASLLRRHGPDAGLSAFTATSTYRHLVDASPAAARSLRDQFANPHAVDRAARLVRMPRSVPYARPADLAAIATPAIVLGARRDPVHPLAMAHEWAARLAAADYRELVSRDIDPIGQARQIRAATVDFLRPYNQGHSS
jgi:pimeloyl-ACP methyl ester carboxylesterase